MNAANGIYPAHQNTINPTLDQNGVHSPFGQHFSGPGNVNPSALDFTSPFPTQVNHRFGDGVGTNPSPGIHQSPFQVPPVVPQKRAREDQVSASPHPPQTSLGQSRSQTPQQGAFGQYGTQASGPNYATPTPFQQHIQASNQATPSPNPSHQQFRPPTSQPNMSSPPPFPGQQSQVGPFPQMPNSMNRMGTPQNPGNHFMPGVQPNQGMQAGAPTGIGPGGMPMAGHMPNMRGPMGASNASPQQQEAFQQYQKSLMMRQRQMQGGMGQIPPNSQPNGLNAQQRATLAAGVTPSVQGRPGMPPGGDRNNPQAQAMQFMSQLQGFMHRQGQQLQPNPSVCGLPIHYFQLFQLYFRLKPNQNPQAWQMMAQQLRIPPEQTVLAAQELRGLYERNLSTFSQYYMRMVEQRGNTQAARMPTQGSPVNDRTARPPVPPGFPAPTAVGPSPIGGSPANRERARATSSVAPDGMDRTTPGKAGSVGGQSSSPQQFPHGSPVPLKVGNQDEAEPKPKIDGHDHMDSIAKLQEPRKLFDPEYKPRQYSSGTHGGFNLDAVADSGAAVHDMKTHHRWEEIGPVDLHTLTMGLQSGFYEEIDYALDRLAALSQRPLFLPECLDLLDGVLEVGRQQLQVLGESTDSAQDLSIPSIEELSSSSRDELYDFRDERRFGSHEYEKQRAIDKLLAVTVILRNLSFPFLDRHGYQERESERNRQELTTPEVQSLLTKIIRVFGGFPADKALSEVAFMDMAKDLVTLFSNVSESLVINSEEDARAFLTFLLSFAPQCHFQCGSQKMTFASYEPLRHQYLPNALDSVAKILARDDPNRGMIKTILQSDLASNDGRSHPLITRAFALAIAPIPDKQFNAPGSHIAMRFADKRKPSISQGMLVLDILASLIPTPAYPSSADFSNTESCLQRQWLESEDAWPSRIIHLVLTLGIHDAQAPIERHSLTHETINSGHSFTSICLRATSMMRRLLEAAEKMDLGSRDKKNGISARVLGTIPLEDMTFSAMMLPRFDVEVIKGLNALAQMTS